MQGTRRRGIVATRAFRLVDRRAACLLRRPLRRRFRWRQMPAAGHTKGDCREGRNHKKIAQEHLHLMIPRIQGLSMCIRRVFLVLQRHAGRRRVSPLRPHCGASVAATPLRQWLRRCGRRPAARRCCRGGGCSPGSRRPPRARWPPQRSRRARLPRLMCRSWPTSCL